MASSLPDRVRAACAAVAATARFVHIDQERIAPYVATLPRAELAEPALAPDDLPVTDPDDVIAWVLTVHAINFGSGFFPVLQKRPGLSGSKTIFAALRHRFGRHGPFSAAELRAIEVTDTAELFGQDPNGPAGPLMAWFADAWRALGDAVEDRWDGHFGGIVEEAAGSAGALSGLLATIDGWQDSWRHGDIDVPLHKRAQIVPAHLAMAFGGTGAGRFDDLDALTIFADNLVPHVLRLDGVLEFDEHLVARIEAEDLLEPGSAEEVEIRAVAVHAAELLVAEARRQGPATAMGLDQILWNRGAGRRYKARPRHRSRSTAY